MPWLTAIGNFFKVVGLALGLIKREEEKKTDFAVAAGASKTALIDEAIDAQKNREDVHNLSDDALNSELRASGAGNKRAGT